MVQLTRRALILAKIESVYKTDPTPTPAADSVRVFDLNVNPIGEVLEREDVQASLSRLAHGIGSRHVEVTFSTHLKHSGTNDAPSDIGPLLRACGLAETINATTSVVYEPISTSFESVALYAYLDGLLWKVLGCRGSVAIAAEVGGWARLNWRFLGHYLAPTDVAIPSGAVVDATKPQAFINGTFTYGAFAAKLKSLELDMANELSLEPDPADAAGIGTIEIVNRSPAGSMDPQAETIASRDFFANWLSGTQVALQAVIGSTAGNICTIDAPKCAKREVGYGERDGVRTFEIPFGMYQDAGDDELKLTFT